ncbi:ABC transporter substrate-binding protein [Sorangium sp. So ce124]|uniref:ABC transporter substrate-binding protein n=1 Tax=Sorangium sp. So ce124 TaxID=3133280 RepID=UPI003F5FEC92
MVPGQPPSPRRRLRLFAACAALAAGACGSNRGERSSGDGRDAIVVGSAVPLTGSSAKMGQDMRQAIEMAVDEINGRGGVLDRRLEVRFEDDACDAEAAVAAAHKLAARGAVAAISGYCSGALLPAEPVYHGARMGAVVPAANAVKLTMQGFDNINLMLPNNQVQARTAADFLTSTLGKRRIAILHDNSAFARELAELTREELRGKAGVVAFDAVTPGERDFSAVLTHLKARRPDAIYWTGYYAEGGLIIRQARGQGIDASIMVGDGSRDAALIATAGLASAEGVFVTSPPSAAELPGAAGWARRYAAAHGEPGPYSAQAYDAAHIVAAAIQAAGSTDRAAVAAAIRAIHHDGVTGAVSFDASGRRQNAAFVVLEIRKGRFALVQGPAAPRADAAPSPPPRAAAEPGPPARSTSRLSNALEQLLNALVIGSFYALVALGYSMVYGIMRMINFAHGDLYALGAFVGYSALALASGSFLGAGALGIGLALLAAMAVTGGVGALMERVAYRPLRRSPKLVLLITAVGMSLLLENAIMLFEPWGPSFRVYPVTLTRAGTSLLGVHVGYAHMAILATALALMWALRRIIGGSTVGLAMRATAFDAETAQLMGIDVDRMISLAFLLGAVMAAAGGVMAGLYYGQINFLMGFIVGIKAFTASVLGGIGNLSGAVVGGMMLGLLEVIGTRGVGGQWKDVFAFAALIAILLIKPTGLLGERVGKRM